MDYIIIPFYITASEQREGLEALLTPLLQIKRGAAAPNLGTFVTDSKLHCPRKKFPPACIH